MPDTENIIIDQTTTGELLKEAVEKYGDRVALYFKGTEVTYDDFYELVCRTAKGLQEKGIGKGSKIGLFMPNTPQYPIFFFAAGLIGATVVNYESGTTQEKFDNQIKASDTDIIVTSDANGFLNIAESSMNKGLLKKVIVTPLGDFLPSRLRIASNIIDNIKRTFNISAKFLLPAPESENYHHFGSLIDNQGDFDKADVSKDDLALLIYTSGTTSAPKGVMLSHGNLTANAEQIAMIFTKQDDLDDDSLIDPAKVGSVTAAIPFYHSFGMMAAMLSPIKMGRELSIVPNPRDLLDVIKTIQTRSNELFAAVPLLLEKIANHPKVGKYVLSSLLQVISGGSACAQSLKESFKNASQSSALRVLEGFGQSEASPVLATETSLINKPGSIGKPLPGTEVKIVDPDDYSKILAPGEKGLALFRGPQVMIGYYNQPELTKEALTEDGWLNTGDIMIQDEEGYLFHAGREKRIIIINSHNINPEEVETQFLKHPAIAQACVVSVQEGDREVAKAFVHVDPKVKLDERFLRKYLEDKLDNYEMPKYIEFTDEPLPEVGIGKPNYRALEDLAAEQMENGTISGVPKQTTQRRLFGGILHFGR